MALEKQQNTVLNYVSFEGGMNSAVPATSLQDNEYQLIKNLEFSFNKLCTRGGLSSPLVSFPANIKALHYCEGTGDVIVVLTDKTVYHVSNSFVANKYTGTVVGNNKPVFCDFDGRVFIASGGKLQYVDFKEKKISTISGSKNCDNVFENFGRLVTSVAGDDNLYYSAVGDPYSDDAWNTDAEGNSNDDSTAKWLEIGYKTNSDIIKVLPIAGDLAAFKNNGDVYSISGQYPNWTVQKVAELTDVIYGEALCVVGSTIAFMTHLGLKTLQTTAVYGNFGVDEMARRINRSMISNVVNPRLHNLIRKRQLMIFPNTTSDNDLKKCFCYAYDMNAGVEMEFAYPIYDMQDTANGVLIASGKSIYKWSMEYPNDNGTPIQQAIVTKKYATSNRLFTRMVDIGVLGEEGKLVVMKWADKTVNYRIPAKRRMIHVFSVCRESVFEVYTEAQIALEYIKLYIFEQ